MTKKPKTAKAAPIKIGKGVKSPKTSTTSTKETIRQNSKQARLLEMLRYADGVTIPQIMDATGWQQHSVRGFLSGTIKKKLGLTVVTNKDKTGVRIYRIKVA